ncbi:hypothetical protein [Muriicola sp. Z0-33]|uniref:hypothetical protein n=1 Tax=Muriicola sp. Z0-33 TaxID=2816957 RepID=UPI0022372A5A|nr:hypothetical protein [Muriicola sp. Z0-33]MCW5516327.1 hypothetical protein [Muriicola sp. Z0-33]
MSGKTATKIFLILLCFSCSDDDMNDGAGMLLDDSIVNMEPEWIRNFGGSGSETAQAIINTNDGGYAVLGYTNSTDGDISDKTMAVNDYWLIKLDTAGNMQWNTTYGGSKDDRGQSVIQTKDGGYAIVGYAMSSDGDGSNNEGFHDNWILKLNSSGGIEWERSFGFSGHDHSYDLVQTEDDGFFFVGFLDVVSSGGAGSTAKFNSITSHGVGEFWGTRLDATGNLIWRRYFGGSNNDRAHSVVQANDGGFIMAGFSESGDADISLAKGSYDYWVVKVDGKGKLVWEKSFGGSGIEVAYDIEKTDDGAYVVTGHTFSDDNDISEQHGESDVWLIKIDDGGEMLWEQTYGGSGFDTAQSVSLTADGGFLISGNSKSTDLANSKNAGENDMWILKTDNQGILEWQMNIGGTAIDTANDAIEDANGKILVVGASPSTDFPMVQNKGQSDLIVLKLQ